MKTSTLKQERSAGMKRKTAVKPVLFLLLLIPAGTWTVLHFFGVHPAVLLLTGFLSTGSVLVLQSYRQQLRQQQAFRNSIFSHLAEGVILVDTGGTIQYMNSAAQELTGWTLTEAKEKAFPEIYAVSNQADHQPLKPLFDRVLDTGLPVFMENSTLLHTRDQQERVIRNSALPLYDTRQRITGVAIIFSDMSALDQITIDLKRSTADYQNMYRATSDTIRDWDMLSGVMLFNTGLTEVLGYNASLQENSYHWWRKQVHPDDLNRVSVQLVEGLEQKAEQLRFHYRFRKATGQYLYFQEKALVSYSETGRPLRLVGAMQDITQFREQELRMSQAIVEAQEKDRLQIGMELHDNIGQLLTATGIYLDTLKDTRTDEARFQEVLHLSRKYAAEALTEIRRLSHELAPASNQLLSLKEVIQSLADNTGKAGMLTIDFNMEESVIPALCPKLQVNLYRIIQEQLNNILKYAAATHVLIRLGVEEGQVVLLIRDNGKGFEQDGSRRGIGLENMRRRAEAYAGEFQCISAAGKGCEINISIPLKTASVVEPG